MDVLKLLQIYFSGAIFWLKNGSYLQEQKPDIFYKKKKSHLPRDMAQEERDVVFFFFLNGARPRVSFFPVIRCSVHAMLFYSWMYLHKLFPAPQKAFPPLFKLYSINTSSGKPFLTLQCNSDAPRCPQNHLQILVTHYIVTYGLFFSLSSLKLLDPRLTEL